METQITLDRKEFYITMIKKRFNKTVVIFILLTGIMHVAAAYYISGYVIDSSTGLPVSNANVTANTSLSTTTDNTGFYNFTNISNGTYIVNASLAEYDTNSTNVTINGSDVTDANISISPLPAPTYMISGYVFDNYGSGLGGSLVQNGSNQNTTLASGYYSVPGLPNGTYNFSYSKSGFNTSYSEVTINGADNISANITLYDATPPASVSDINITTGNFYINNTWVNPDDTDFNYTWFRYSNGTTLKNVSKPTNYLNLILQPHYIQNISAQTVDNYSNVNQTMIWFNTTIPNNAPVQTTLGNKTVYEGQWLNFTVSAIDADNDIITYGTNATKGAFNTTTGDFSWIPNYGNAGFYFWNFNSSDDYGSIANENIAVTVINVPLSVTNSSPAGDLATMVGAPQTFTITLNRTANVTWYINDSLVQGNSSVASADYTNSTAGIGAYNVTGIANDGYDSTGRTWNWTIVPQPVYAPEITSWGNSKTNDTNLTLAVNAGESVNFNATANQTITTWNWYQDGMNQNNNYDNFTMSWTTAGTETIQVNATNANGTSNTVTWNISVQALPAIYIPPSPVNISSTTDNFRVNTTWQAGAGNVTDSYNISVNGAWTNGTTNTFVNSSLSAHAWQNVTVYAYNASGGGSLSISPATKNTQIPNNPPVQSSIGNKSVAEGQWLNFTVNATGADNDTITYGTNATKGTFDTTTGNFSWLATYSDAGAYVWYFNSSDGYGGIASETITVTVNNTPLSITSFSPPADPATVQGNVQDFNITLGRAANVTWYMNGTPVQTNISTISASYTNSTARAGTWNVTAGATDGIDVVSKIWNWTVISQPVYNVSGYVFDNYGSGLGGVLVQNGSNQNTTLASGYYLVTGLPNGTYNFSFSKAGFDIGYLEIAINGADNTSANISLSPLPVPAYVISGYITNVSSGLPLDGATVQINANLSTITNNTGFYNLTGLTNGTYIVNASFTEYDTNSTNITLDGSNVIDANISLSPSPAFTYAISGYVTDASNGLPLSNATVMTNTSLFTIANETGFYNFTGLSNGTYIVNASLAGYNTNSTNVTINGTNATNASIPLSPLPVPTYLISGYVTNVSSGLPLDNATVITNTSLSTTTNSSGFYNFIDLSNGSYILSSNLTGYSTNSTNVTINGLDVTNANISLSASSGGGGGSSGIGIGTGPGIGGGMDVGAGISYNISGYVLDSYTLNGLGGANVTLNTTVNTSMQNTSNSTGFYIITGLTNGSYNIKVSLYGYPDNFTNITISGADIINANIYLTLPSTQCTDCHYSFSYMNSSDRPDLYLNQTQVNESVHAALDCRDCHTNTTVHPPPKSGWKWCEDCHANQQNPPTNKSRHNIVANPWNNLYNGISAVNITLCVTCHDPVLYNNSINTYGREGGIDCDYCHTFPDNVID